MSKRIVVNSILEASRNLINTVNKITFSYPVAYVYNPMDYAWAAQKLYIERYANTSKKILFLGINPGPFGMVQTGVPFGEVDAVRNWLNISASIKKPLLENPRRLVKGFKCKRSEVSGRRLWSLFAKHFESADVFFKNHFVINYCPLFFMKTSGANYTPDKLLIQEKDLLYKACDRYLRKIVKILKPNWIIGIGAYSEIRGRKAIKDNNINYGRILHPSPICPATNHNWGYLATKKLLQLGVWKNI